MRSSEQNPRHSDVGMWASQPATQSLGQMPDSILGLGRQLTKTLDCESKALGVGELKQEPQT